MERGSDRDRAISITVTHVLTIGITTILIAVLVTSAGTMLETETNRSGDAALETVGERIADEVGNVDQIAGENDDDVMMTTDHPRTLVNSQYTVELRKQCDAPLLDGTTDCVRLTARDTDAVAHVPVKTDADIRSSSASGGPIEIVYENGEIWIREGVQ
ncbi:DUF7266 family protein [Natrinema salaciae]|uniref:DUF7266 family protein n=1 Tax=Natrinema salaciae TaxID=1186196 RepID=UPI000B89D4CD|nr:hypothetical protein [Natrinema salaciae]